MNHQLLKYVEGWKRGASGKDPHAGREDDRTYMRGWGDGKAKLREAEAREADHLNASEERVSSNPRDQSVSASKARGMFDRIQSGQVKVK